MTRSEILDAAKNCVCGKREQDYGSPENNFNTIARLWTIYLQAANNGRAPAIYEKDVAIMMSLLKIARIATGTATDDSFIDLAGYAACGGEVACNTKISDD